MNPIEINLRSELKVPDVFLLGIEGSNLSGNKRTCSGSQVRRINLLSFTKIRQSPNSNINLVLNW